MNQLKDSPKGLDLSKELKRHLVLIKILEEKYLLAGIHEKIHLLSEWREIINELKLLVQLQPDYVRRNGVFESINLAI